MSGRPCSPARAMGAQAKMLPCKQVSCQQDPCACLKKWSSVAAASSFTPPPPSWTQLASLVRCCWMAMLQRMQQVQHQWLKGGTPMSLT